MNVYELFKEENVLFVIIDLRLCLWNVRRMGSQDRICEGVHFDPPLQKLLTSSVLQESHAKLFDNERSVAADV